MSTFNEGQPGTARAKAETGIPRLPGTPASTPQPHQQHMPLQTSFDACMQHVRVQVLSMHSLANTIPGRHTTHTHTHTPAAAPTNTRTAPHLGYACIQHIRVQRAEHVQLEAYCACHAVKRHCPNEGIRSRASPHSTWHSGTTGWMPMTKKD
eukprot:388985-Pelagomonas_calceolata.AAC.1